MCQISLKSETYGETYLLIWHGMTQRLIAMLPQCLLPICPTLLWKSLSSYAEQHCITDPC